LIKDWKTKEVVENGEWKRKRILKNMSKKCSMKEKERKYCDMNKESPWMKNGECERGWIIMMKNSTNMLFYPLRLFESKEKQWFLLA
jgi:molybdopterin-biosynthesis enzyme MoeA-like protein